MTVNASDERAVKMENLLLFLDEVTLSTLNSGLPVSKRERESMFLLTCPRIASVGGGLPLLGRLLIRSW